MALHRIALKVGAFQKKLGHPKWVRNRGNLFTPRMWKQYWLERSIPKLSSGAKLWIYATRPTAAVVGVATIAKVVHANPKTIWKRHRNGIRINHDVFKDYFKGSQEAVAIILAAVNRVGPITIEQLRRIRARFHPPQVMTVLTTSEAKTLKKLAR
jgi:predicted transcriptional regulator